MLVLVNEPGYVVLLHTIIILLLFLYESGSSGWAPYLARRPEAKRKYTFSKNLVNLYLYLIEVPRLGRR